MAEWTLRLETIRRRVDFLATPDILQIVIRGA